MSTKSTKQRLAGMDREVLAALPREPLAWAVPDIARDLLGRADASGLSVIQASLNRLRPWLYVEFRSTGAYGRKTRYGIRADRWRQAKAALEQPAASCQGGACQRRDRGSA